METINKIATSASDNQRYPPFCQLASTNEKAFETFRQNPLYLEILEHFSFEDGLEFEKIIRRENPRLLEDLDIFQSNDKYGGPVVFNYEYAGKISPSTLYYLMHLSYLEKLFISLNGLKIVEIGGGYGGLAKMIMDKYVVRSYTIFDLPEVNALTAKYLKKFGTKYIEKVKFGNLDQMGQKFDLCISNCAFTECAPHVQEKYISTVLKNSKSGFIIYNYRTESLHPVILLNKLRDAGLKKMGSWPVTYSQANIFILGWNAALRLKPLPYKRRYFYRYFPKVYFILLKFYKTLKNL